MKPSRKLRTLAVVALAASTASACKPKPAPDRAAVCAAPETAEGLANVAFANAGVPSSGVTILLGSPVLDGYDATTKRTTCKATFGLAFRGSLAALDAAKGMKILQGGGLGFKAAQDAEALQSQQSFTVQPQAGGDGDVYAMTADTASQLQAWVTASQLAADHENDPPTSAPASTSPASSADNPAPPDPSAADGNVMDGNEADQAPQASPPPQT